MLIKNHKLVAEAGDAAIQVLNSPNQGGVITPQYLVIHYTAGRSAESSVAHFMNKDAKASAHIVIGMDGKITQVVPFNKNAWHAGKSKWNGLVGLNSHSIGIELDNPGVMTRTGSKWIAWFGKEYPASVITEAIHKHQEVSAGWHIFPEKQIESCIKLSKLLVTNYQLLDIVGHEDISPFRKTDPGPAFPMENFKSIVLGREDDVADIFKVNTDDTNLRSGAGNNFPVLAKLKKGMKVEYLKRNLNWIHVFVVSKVQGLNEPEGWIHSSLLDKV
jgi:N-acetylmuramoyl-L-alanine amidase